jgi:hypothetical protein
MSHAVYDICLHSIIIFLFSFNSAIPFLDYLLVFNDRLKDKSVLSSIFVEDFPCPLVLSTVDDDFTVRFPELKWLSFV